MDVWRQMLDQVGHSLVDLGRFDDVVVVEDQHQVVGQLVEVVQENGDAHIDRVLGRALWCMRDVGVRNRHGYCSANVGPEQRRVVVSTIE